MISYFYALITAFLMSGGQIFFKKAAMLNTQNESVGFFLKYLTNHWFMIGLFIFGVSTITWTRALSGEKLSQLYPLTSLAYIITAILAFIIFKEKITPLNIVGMLIILVGVYLISSGK